ncbi:hypothetical protein ACGFYU_31555 [Streptomyces sp. NPDC048337]|uniref:hypothetical protein n=1 Tax=Streptomyces sp. NPDC048337 TaxID=3365535 RepID=UPI003711E2D9
MVRRLAGVVGAVVSAGLLALLFVLASRHHSIWVYLLFVFVLPWPVMCLVVAFDNGDTGGTDSGGSGYGGDGGVGLGGL